MNTSILALSLGWIFLPAAFLHAEAPVEALERYVASLKVKFPTVPTISTKELGSLHPTPILLDVLEEKEFVVSHLPGAQHAENDPVAQLRQLGVHNDTLVVVYCSVGYRSSLLAEKLQQSGFSNVRNLEGSIFAWANEGRPIVNAHGTASGVHPFNLLWGRYLDKAKWQWESIPKANAPN